MKKQSLKTWKALSEPVHKDCRNCKHNKKDLPLLENRFCQDNCSESLAAEFEALLEWEEDEPKKRKKKTRKFMWEYNGIK